jgi:hypothetical protein
MPEKNSIHKEMNMNPRCKISENYGLFFNAMAKGDKNNINDYEDREISKEIYYQMMRLRFYAGKYSIDVDRTANHSLGLIFQDLIAYYLRVFLPEEYEVFIEKSTEGKNGKTLWPDISIIKNDDLYPHFIIEVKTNAGWVRDELKIKHGKKTELEKRIEKLYEQTGIDENHIIYIFESPVNVKKDFLSKYYDINSGKGKKAQKHPTDRPFCYIYPLFYTTDLYYLDRSDFMKKKGFTEKEIKKMDENEIKKNFYAEDHKTKKTYFDSLEKEYFDELFNDNIITPFETIIKMILE